MKILMPFPNMEKSASSLDTETLTSQFWLVHSCLLALHDNAELPTALECWRGHDNALVVYGIALYRELQKRGYQSSDRLLRGYMCAKNEDFKKPLWFGDNEIHAYDRALLLKQNPAYYKRFYWNVKNV